MPYIKKEDRFALDGSIDQLVQAIKLNLTPPSQPGAVNYTFCRILLAMLGDHPNYVAYNTAIGILSAVDFEIKRRFLAPYEDTKITENGDITG